MNAEPGNFNATEAIRDDGVLRMLDEVATRGLTRAIDLEAAAFLIRDADGNLNCAMWPTSDQRKLQNYRAPMPPGTVAIVHTHPLNAHEPSRGDVLEAVRLRIPILVLTRLSIAVADPDTGRRVMLIQQMNWRRNIQRGTSVCTELPRLWGL
jgi:hypothetical protein